MRYSKLFWWAAYVALISASGRTSRLTEINGYRQAQTGKFFAVLSFLPVIAFAVTAHRAYWADYFFYMRYYVSLPGSLMDGIRLIGTASDSWLFYALALVVKLLTGGSVFAYRLALACVQVFPILFFFRRYSTDLPFALYMCLVMTMPISWMLNGVRQLCAAAILYGATRYVIERKKGKLLFWFAAACLMHQTAVIMLPIIIVAQGKAWNQKTILAILATLVLVCLFSARAGAYDSLATAAGYNTMYYMNDDGVHPLRVLVSFVPVLLSFVFRRKLNQEKAPILNYCANMSIITFCLYAVAMVTSGILVGRLPLYTVMYSYILLPYLIRCFGGTSAKLVKSATVLCYGLYYLVLNGIR